MTAPSFDDISVDDFTPESNGTGRHRKEEPSLNFVEADIGDFIRRPKTRIATEYEKKTAAALNAAMRFTAARPETITDAAAIIAYGDSFAAATGELAEHNERTRKAIDLILTPESPYLMFLIAAIPLFSQLARNHETQLSTIPARFSRDGRRQRKAIRIVQKPNRPGITVKIPLLRKQFKIPVSFRLNLGFFRASTVDPNALAVGVFSNEKVMKALSKRGIEIAWPKVPSREPNL